MAKVKREVKELIYEHMNDVFQEHNGNIELDSKEKYFFKDYFEDFKVDMINYIKDRENNGK